MRYLSYFFYIAWHWGISMAIFVIWYEIRGEKQFGVRTIGTDSLRKEIPLEELQHASMYEPVNYYTSTWLLDHLEPEEKDTAFIDVGCGKGRVLAIAAAYGFKQIIGIDFSPKLYGCAVKTAEALEARYLQTKVDIACADARHYELPEEVGVIFLFNPFDEVIMTDFIEQVMVSLLKRPRPLKVLYANPQCKQLWLDAGFKEVASFQKLKHLKGSVLTYSWNVL
jgi:SAM-dependent methyltransferase